MALNKHDISKLRRIIAAAEALIERHSGEPAGRGSAARKNAPKKRIRRTGQDLARFRRLLKSERQKGVPVAEIAKRHGVSSAYIYMIA